MTAALLHFDGYPLLRIGRPRALPNRLVTAAPSGGVNTC